MTHEEAQRVADQFMQIMPLVMRVVSADIRSARSDLNPAYYRLMGMLHHGTWNLGELAERQAVSKPTMSKTITTLEERGWVERAHSKDDRRVVLVSLTDEGRKVSNQVRQEMVNRMAQILMPLDAEDQETLIVALTILNDVFTAELDATPESKTVDN